MNKGGSRKGRTARLGIFSTLLVFAASLFALGSFAQETTQETVGDSKPTSGVILTLNGPVTPANAGYLEREISNASDAGKDLIVIEIDTPGGLVDSMKTIIKAILNSDTPVATFVSPQGARSASAGVYIMYSAHISAMAPSTNTGAATPVSIGGEGEEGGDNPFEDGGGLKPASDPRQVDQPASTEGGSEAEALDAARDNAPESARDARPNEPILTNDDAAPPVLGNDDAMRAKIINDSVAYIRALAEERGRNADWAEEAVREASSITSRQALELNVIDLIADDLDDLLQQIDGRVVMTPSGEKTLKTSNIVMERVEQTFVEEILGFFANPNVAVILMSLATTAIVIELWNPGSLLPGIIGFVFLALGLYSFQVLPYNSLGAALMLIGAVLILVEAYTPTFGLAGLTGLAIFGAGMYMIFPDGFKVSMAVIGAIMASVGAFLGAVLIAVIGSRNHGPMIGGEAIRKREGIVDDWDGKEGWVIVEGERWRARSDKPMSPGDKVRVVEIDGLVLVVRQAKAGGLLGGLAPKEA